MLRITTFLRRIGLAEKEAVTYETLVNKGDLSVAELSALTKYKRGDLYNIVKSLTEKGLVEQRDEPGKAVFRIVDPYALYGQLEVQKSRLAEASLVADSLLPQLVSQFNLVTGKPAVRYFEGIPGLRRVYEELFASNTTEILLLRSIYDNASPEMSAFVNDIAAEQTRRNIHLRIVAPLEEKSRRRLEQTDKERNIERRIVEANQLNLPAQILIWQNSVAIFSLRHTVVATLMENQDIAETFRAIFEYVWEKSAPYHESLVASWNQPSLQGKSR